MNTSTKVIITLMLTSLAIPSFAQFQSNSWNDEMSDTKTIERYTKNRSGSFGFRCDLTKGQDPDFMFTFGSDDSLATPNAFVDVRFRVDKGDIFELKGRTYNNSYRSGVIRSSDKKLLTELQKGNNLLVEIRKYNEVKFKTKFSLSGSAIALKETAGTCGALSTLTAEQHKQIRDLERLRDAEINRIKFEYNTKISAITGQ